MLSLSQRVHESQDDTAHRDERSDLNHGESRPVQGHEVLSVAELQSHQSKHLHDDRHQRNADASQVEPDASLDGPFPLLIRLRKFIYSV